MNPASPVQLRLIGDRTAVAATLAVLDTVFTLTDVSEPDTARRGVRVYATVTRRTPPTGGIR
ncbi:hypothetical protein [Catellatospora sp. NPDC049609]|uniref:hypothetical protein n=1 Tax=Catellatospora sp. NPDC049609 TaxID=3155505 RepID=UPI00342A975E